MTEIIMWLKLNWNYILEIIGGVVSVCSILIKIIPSEKDDTIFYSIVNFISKFSIFNTKIDQKILDEAKKRK